MSQNRGNKVGQLWIQDCEIKECKSQGRWHYHRLNPRGWAVKMTEMTVRRALAIVAAFDQLLEEGGEDWTDLNLKVWRDTMGSVNLTGRELPELWARYKAGTLHQQILDLADNLVMEDLSKESRKEIRDGKRRIRKELDSRS